MGTLIDLGSDITAPLPPQSTPEGQDIVSQLKDLGITGGQTGPQQSAAPPAAVEQSHDEFDMFAKSRTAYADTTGYVSLDYCMDANSPLSLLGALRTKT